MRSTIRKSGAVLAIGASLLAACQSSVPNQVLTKPAPASSLVSTPVPPPRVRDFWVFHPPQQRQLFVVDQRAVITTRRDTAARVDSVSSHTELSFYNSNGPGPNIRGEITAFVVRAAGAVAGTPKGIELPLLFSARYSARDPQLAFDRVEGYGDCGTPAFAVVQSLRDLTFHAPDTLRIGTAWQDSSRFLVCRDEIPMYATVLRDFRVTGTVDENSRTLLTIARSSRTELVGNGFPFGEHAIVTGTGTGQLVYQIDPKTGELISASGTAILDLTERNELQGSPRIQTAHQTAEIRIGRS